MGAQHVVHSADGWQVESEGAEQASATAPTQRAAIASARAIVAGQGGGQVVVHAQDGTIRENIAVGADPETSSTAEVQPISRPTEGDVLELVLDDHRRFEDLLRQLRDRTQDRKARLAELAAVVIAHSEAEEAEVYPYLKRRNVTDPEEVEHGKEEHDEGHVALAGLFDTSDPYTESFDEGVEELSQALSHHLDEEEREVLNPARTEVAESRRAQLGQRFAAERVAQLDADCGRADNVRRIASRAHSRSGV